MTGTIGELATQILAGVLAMRCLAEAMESDQIAPGDASMAMGFVAEEVKERVLRLCSLPQALERADPG